MKNTLLATATAVSLLIGAAAPALAADIKDQKVALVSVDVSKVTNAVRASKLIGTTVNNDQKETIGKVSDLLISHDDKVPYAVIDVGGFLGLGGKYVLIPFDSISIEQNGKNSQILVVPGADKNALRSLPEFHYAK